MQSATFVTKPAVDVDLPLFLNEEMLEFDKSTLSPDKIVSSTTPR